jgi:hypothetical protein
LFVDAKIERLDEQVEAFRASATTRACAATS